MPSGDSTINDEVRTAHANGDEAATPFTLLASVERLEQAEKSFLIEVTRGLERGALADPPYAVAACFQDARFVTPRTRASYAALAAAGAPCRLHARGLQAWLAPGVTGVSLSDDDPLVDEWVLVVPGRRPSVFAATDYGPTDVEDLRRGFRFAVSRDPEIVARCGAMLGLDPAPDTRT